MALGNSEMFNVKDNIRGGINDSFTCTPLQKMDILIRNNSITNFMITKFDNPPVRGVRSLSKL